MPLTASTLATTLDIATEEMTRLAPFLDDLDGWNGGDCDSGTNAHITLNAMRDAVHLVAPDAPLALACDSALNAGISNGSGHLGILLTGILSSWVHHLEEAPDLTPVLARRMLSADPREAGLSMAFSPAITAVLTEAAHELDLMGETLPELPEVISTFSAQAQFGLVNATNEATGRVDAGAAVLALFYASFDAAVRGDHGMLQSFTSMLAELAENAEGRVARHNPPAPDRAFTVDIILHGTQDDAQRAIQQLTSLGVRFSCIGHADVFGLGEWRLHIDTSAPLSVRPRTGRVLRFHVCDARPDEEIGVDTLADGVTHRGIRLLERKPLRRVERAAVTACTRSPGLVEDLALAGAHVLLDPTPEDASALTAPALAASTGICMIVPCDADSAALAHRSADAHVQKHLGSSILVGDTRSEADALLVARGCAPLFVPQPGGQSVQTALIRMLEENSTAALAPARSMEIPRNWDDTDIARMITDLASDTPSRWILLTGRDDGALLISVVRQILASPHLPDGVGNDLEVIDARPAETSLIQAIR